jgi:hypothetical protein
MNTVREVIPVNGNIMLPSECMRGFKKAVKIGYYKEFYKKGLITAAQLEKLLLMQK